MVRIILLFFILSHSIIFSAKANPYVDASIDQGAQAKFPIQGTITITHRKYEKIDAHSFYLDKKPLEAVFVKDVKMFATSDDILSIYSFELPAKEPGQLLLPSISVKIEGKIYQSLPSPYDVLGSSYSQKKTLLQQTSDIPSILKLQASIRGPSILYPGERTKLFYKISYNRNIDLTLSNLPMIHPDHFIKIGDVQVEDTQMADLTVQTLTQEIEASQIGSFSLGPSTIEGHSYVLQSNQKVYDPLLLKAEAPAVILEVRPFPKSSQPLSFTGALGKIAAEVSLNSTLATVGEALHLQITIHGVSNLTELLLPPLNDQPGFSGFFQMSDLPPLAEVKGAAKIFYVDIHPMTSLSTEIPSIQLSSFDTDKGTYVINNTSPIPLKISEKEIMTPHFDSIPFLKDFSTAMKWPLPSISPLNIEMGTSFSFEQSSTESYRRLETWILFFAILLLLLQLYIHDWWKKRHHRQISTAEKMLKHSLKSGNLKELENAFWQRLWEKEKVPQGMYRLRKISEETGLASISTFLFYLQALQYGNEKSLDLKALQKKAQELFKKI